MTRPDTTPDGALLPCPFCGRPPKTWQHLTPPIFCVSCGVQPQTVDGLSWVQAIAAWNRRAPTPPVSVREAAAVPEVAALIRAASIARNDMIATRGPFWAEQHYGELLEALHPFNALAAPPAIGEGRA